MSRTKGYFERLSQAMGLEGLINDDVRRLGTMLMEMATKYHLPMALLDDNLLLLNNKRPHITLSQVDDRSDPIYIFGLEEDGGGDVWRLLVMQSLQQAFENMFGEKFNIAFSDVCPDCGKRLQNGKCVCSFVPLGWQTVDLDAV